MSDSHQYENLIDESTPSNTPGEEEHNPRDDIALNTETKYDEDVAILTEMGFNSSMISKVYIFLHPTSINQAIQFMTQENGKYQHNFYRQHQARIVYRIVVSFAERNRKIITIM